MASVLKALTGLLLVVLISACSSSLSKPPNAASAAPAATAPVSTAANAVTGVELAKDFSDGQAVNPTTTFSPTDNAFHLIIDLGDGAGGAKVGANWYAIDAGPYKNRKLDSESYTVKNGETRVHAFLSN